MPYKNKKDQSASAKKHYENNKIKVIERSIIHKRNTRIFHTTYVNKYLSENNCVDCGESDPIVLEFDHVRGEKSFNISDMVRKTGHSLVKIKEEIEKCDVRCANCHRRATYNRRHEEKLLVA